MSWILIPFVALADFIESLWALATDSLARLEAKLILRSIRKKFIPVAILIALPASAQPLKEGVGFPGVPPEFNSSWCGQKRPGGCTTLAPPGFDCRLCPTNGWLGYYAENEYRSVAALGTCWELDWWGTKSQWNGTVVLDHFGTGRQKELDWFKVTTPVTSSEYRVCWYESHWEGGSPDFPVVIERSQQLNDFRVIEAVRQGRWGPGLVNYLGFDPVFGGWTSGRAGLWTVWLDNRLTEEPPPEPEPEPTPEPEPEPEPPAIPKPPSCKQALSERAAKGLEAARDLPLLIGPGRRANARALAEWVDAVILCIEQLEEHRNTYWPGEESTGRAETRIVP